MEFQEFIPELKDCLEGDCNGGVHLDLLLLLWFGHALCTVYRQEQRGKKEAAADRKKKVQALPSSSELGKILSETVTPSDSAALSQALATEQERQTLATHQ